VILADVEKHGGPESGLVRWAIAYRERQFRERDIQRGQQRLFVGDAA